MFGPVPCTFGDVACLFSPEVCQFVVNVVVGVVVVGVIVVVVVGVVGGNIIVAFPVVGWGSATVTAAAWRHQAMVVVLAGVLRGA